MRYGLTVIGVAVTAAYALAMWMVVGEKLGDFKWLELNEAGDFLAGIFGPLTLFWLILGFIQQGYELRQNSEALKQQARELEKSVEQQRLMVQVARDEHQATLQQLDLERQRVQEEREALRRANSPRFFLSDGAISQGVRGTRWQYRLHNGGRECTEVRVQFTGTNDLELSGGLATPHLGGTGSMELEFHMPGLPHDMAGGALLVHYTGALGTRDVASFDVSIVDGDFLIRPVSGA